MATGEGPGPGAGAPRGAARRAALVAAAAELVAAGGPAALSARAAARGAGVPLAAVTYYFDDVPALLREAVEALLDDLGERVRAASATAPPPAAEDRGATALAEALVGLVLGPYGGRGAAGLRALYARTLELSADPALAPRLRAFDAACADAVARLLRSAGREAVAARAVLALVDGWLVAAAVAGEAGPAGESGDGRALERWAAERLAPGLLALAPLAPEPVR
ncbi:hypothetical protein WDV85_01610 [Pseudokineococcus sp. 5B2Z-1]|uniref:hypothetical protein n=1 Tax=Pseudokineococcus sp. 5B2Z-1 TaxID=3132744 RepID=UPI0030A811C6